MEIDKPTIDDHTNANHDHSDAANGGTLSSYLQNINSENLTELADVDTDKSKTPADGDVLTFDGTDWNAETPAGSGGGSPFGANVTIGATGDYATLTAYAGNDSAGDVVFIDGSHSLTGNASITSANVTLVSNGWHNIVDLVSYTLTLSGGGVKVKGFKFETGSGGVTVGSGVDNIVEDMWFYFESASPTTYGLYASGANTVVQKCTFTDAITTAPSLQRLWLNGQGTKFLDNRVKVAQHATFGMVRYQPENGILSGNSFEAVTTGETIVYCAQNYQTISNNRFLDEVGCDRIIYNPSGGGLTITGNGIYHNTLVDNTVGIETTQRCMVTGNIFNSGNICTNVGIKIIGTGCTVTGNALYMGDSSTGHSAQGIVVNSAIDNTTISGNTVNNARWGIYISASTCDNTVVTGNNVYGCNDALFDSGTGTVDSGNYFNA